MEGKYEVAFDFTMDGQENLLEKVWPTAIGKRIIKAELGLDPKTDNGDDVRYQTDDPAVFVELLKLAVQFSAGGWWVAHPMPAKTTVFHLPHRGGKYSNCPDYKPKVTQ